MALSWPVLVILVQAFIAQVELCEIPGGQTQLIRSLNLKLLRATLDITQDANPSIYVGLRLSEDHNLEKETEYLQRLKPLTKTLSGSSFNVKEGEPKTGLIALHLLAQKASCEGTDAFLRSRLTTHLKHHLHKEKESIVLNDKPLSSYYQYSLGILAMCVNGKFIDKHFINKLIHAEENKKFVYGESLSVDTEAMAGLALLCSKNSNHYPREVVVDIKKAVKRIKETILASQGTDGQFGNIYSTPLAVQFLLEIGGWSGKESCSRAITALLEAVKQGKFSNPMMMSQLMPVLHEKSYLDVDSIKCEEITGNPLVIPSSTTLDEGVIDNDNTKYVRLVVESQNYNKVFEVPSVSSLLDVLKSAQNLDAHFSFETKESLYGPFLTKVNKVEGHWQLLKEPNISLLQGVADYIPGDGETIILTL